MLGLRLAVLHNLYFYNELMAKIRESLEKGEFSAFRSRYSDLLAQRI
jgi:queuine tRNA-ribosyltransferase